MWTIKGYVVFTATSVSKSKYLNLCIRSSLTLAPSVLTAYVKSDQAFSFMLT